jgi:hypothetical protein
LRRKGIDDSFTLIAAMASRSTWLILPRMVRVMTILMDRARQWCRQTGRKTFVLAAFLLSVSGRTPGERRFPA